MKTKNYFIIPVLALLTASSCQDEDRNWQPATGEEVRFGATLEQKAGSRTIYGEENTVNGTFPIYWVNGDEVIVSSPECGAGNGVGTANYKVTVEGAAQNYATSLDKTGEIGVRWGENETGTFYSVYPAGQAALNTNDYETVTLRMPFSQENELITENGVQTIQPDMRACFMYAKEADVRSGKTVNLQYTPLSTALRFTLNGPTGTDEAPITISEIRLTAPENVSIAGEFSVDLNTAAADALPTVTAVNGTNVISVLTTDEGNGFPVLEYGEQLEMNVFLMLERETQITNNWIIDIIANGVRYRKNLGSSEGTNPTLVPGMIHRLPEFPSFSSPVWNVSNWMKNIPRNVYLSEISIPGSWNSLNPDFQGANPSIEEQYNAGVRAFHLDTRWRATDDWLGWMGNSPITDLGIANGGGTYNVVGDNGERLQCMTQDAPTFESALGEIARHVKEDEYMVVYCTFAQGSTVYGDWRAEIAEACSNNEAIIDARTLNANSTVGDVLGKVIVIVSTYTPGEVSSKTFFTDLRNELDQKEYQDYPYLTRALTFNNTTESGISLYATYAQITYDGEGENPSDRGYAPSLNERQTKCENLLNWSQTNYNTGLFQHNAWIYMGLGGYVLEHRDGDIAGVLDSEDYNLVNNQLIPWLDGKLSTMGTAKSYYPVGIVFMNNVLNNREGTTADITQTVKDVLLLNNKYRKAYNPDLSPVTGKPIDGGVQSAAPGYSSGMTDNNTNAIGWTKVD